MSIDFFIPEVSGQTSSVETLCKNQIAVMENVKQGIEAFVAESNLSGEAYESAKEYFQAVYIPLADGFILLSEEMIRAHQRFVNDYLSQVDSNSLQSSVLEQQIRELEMMIRALEAMRLSSAGTSAASAAMIAALRALLEKLKEKLERLINYHSSSPQIFAGTESILADVEKGLQEVKSGRAWNASANRFDTNMLDMSWVAGINERKKEEEINQIFKILAAMNSEELEEAEKLATKEPKALLTYLLNKSKYVVEYGIEPIVTMVDEISKNPNEVAAIVREYKAIYGPKGENPFIIFNEKSMKRASFLLDHAKLIGRANLGIGSALFVYGMYDDVLYSKKTFGEALAHNSSGLGFSALAGLGGAGATASLLTLTSVSNPIGWAALGGGAIAIAASYFYDYLYENNTFRFKDTINYFGAQIDNDIQYAKENPSASVIKLGGMANPGLSILLPFYKYNIFDIQKKVNVGESKIVDLSEQTTLFIGKTLGRTYCLISK